MGRQPNLKAREKIVEAATRLFHVHGYKGVSMDDVAKAAGMKKANLFHYYPRKEDLGMAVMCRGSECQKSEVKECLTSCEDPIRAIEGIFEDAAKEMRREGCERGCFMGGLAQEVSDQSEALRQKIASCMDEWIMEMAGFLESWMRKGYFKKNFEPRESTEAIISLFEGAMLISKTSRKPRALESARKVVTVYLKAFKV